MRFRHITRALSSVRAPCTVAAPALLRAVPPVFRRTSIASRLSSAGIQRAAFHASRGSWGVIPYKLTDIGEGIAEVELLQWFVKEGDEIEEFDKVCEVQSDKATVEITSRYAGTVKSLHYAVGDLAKVGLPLIDIDVEGEEGTVAEDAAKEESKTAQSPPQSAPGGAASSITPAKTSTTPPQYSGPLTASGKVLATPAVRRIAKENSVDLKLVPASGKGGRILKEDVLRFLSGETAPAATAGTTVGAVSAIPEDQVVPIRGLQRIMVKTMTDSLSIPHFGYCDEIEMNAAREMRMQLKAESQARGIKFSYMPLIIKATSMAIKQYPTLNSKVSDDVSHLLVRGSHNIGVAMDSPVGLIVPNIKNVEGLSVFEVAAELQRLHALALEGKLGQDDLSGGTITLSNIGAIGGTYAKPVLTTNEVAIAALGKIRKLPRFDSNGDVMSKDIMEVSWSADHRVVDGATMARFSNAMKKFIEEPFTMISDLR